MKAALVHSLLAAGLVKPNLLRTWGDAPAALSRSDLPSEPFDLQALRQFAGLAFKVRHNPLRGPYANTFRLLSLCGLEITLFSDYACACAEQGLALAAQNEERARLLVQFIDQWHNPALPAHALLRDMARHEQAVSELERADAVAGAPQGQAAAPGPDSKLCPRGAMRLQESRYHPLAILAAMRVPTPDFSTLNTGSHLLAYWRAPASPSVQLVELDAFGFALLQYADGSRSLRELGALLGIGRARRAGMLALAQQLVQAGLLATDATAVPCI